MNYWLILIPVLSALLGWTGSWIAGKILFRKIIPARQQYLARQIGKTVSGQISFAGLEEKINAPGNVKKIMPLVEGHIDDFLRNKLKEKMPMIGMFIGDKTISSLKEVFLQEIEDLFPVVLKQFVGNIQNEFDIETMVSNKIAGIQPAKIEKTFSPALNYFALAAAISGFVIGLVNALFFFFLQ